MCRPAKLTQLLLLALIATLVACSPAATPIPPTSTSIPPTSTSTSIPPTPIPPTSTNPPPTSTPAPTSTIPPKPTPELMQGKFDAGGVNLYLICWGQGSQGSPTVVFDAGSGADSNTWAKVLLDLRYHVRVCAYDRASMGKSDSQTGLRTSGQSAEQLHALLTSANVQGPYLVVGHSSGGMNMLVFADRYRDEVAGVVLVDSVHPDLPQQMSAVLPTPAPNESYDLSELRKFSGPSWADYPEPWDMATTLAQVRAVKSLGNIPLAVLVATDPTKSGWGNIPDDLKARLDKISLDLQKEYLKLSTDSSLILAEHSAHSIQQDEPQVVIDAIMKLVDKARQK
jgi:pimeloyl-ACP methyl ester carboxylesterase